MHDRERDLLGQTRIITEVYFFCSVVASCCCSPCPIPHSRVVANEVSYYNSGHRPKLSPDHFDLLLHICSLSHEFCYVGGEQLLILKFHHMIFCHWMLHQFLILEQQCLSTDFCVLGGCTVCWACVFILCSEQKINYKNCAMQSSCTPIEVVLKLKLLKLKNRKSVIWLWRFFCPWTI